MFYCLNSNKSMKWTNHPKKVKIIKSPQSGQTPPKKVKILISPQSGRITQRGWKFLSTKWTDHPKRAKILTSPQEWTNHPKRVKVLKSPQSGWTPPKRVKILIHKVNGSPKEGENSYKSTRVDGSPKEGERSPQSGRNPTPPKRVKILISPQSWWITQRMWKFLSTKWKNHPKRVKILNPQSRRTPQRGWKFLKSTRWMDCPWNQVHGGRFILWGWKMQNAPIKTDLLDKFLKWMNCKKFWMGVCFESKNLKYLGGRLSQ